MNPFEKYTKHYPEDSEGRIAEDENAIIMIKALLGFHRRTSILSDGAEKWSDDLYGAALETALLRISEDLEKCRCIFGHTENKPESRSDPYNQ